MATILLFFIFTVLVYLRRNALSIYEFVFIVLLLIHVLVSLLRVQTQNRHAQNLSIRLRETFTDEETQSEEVVTYNESGVTWSDLGDLPTKVGTTIMPTLDDLVKGMTQGSSGDGASQDADIDADFVAKRRDRFAHRAGQRSTTIAHIYRDANFALSLYKNLYSNEFTTLMETIGVKVPTKDELDFEKKVDEEQVDMIKESNIIEAEEDVYKGGVKQPGSDE